MPPFDRYLNVKLWRSNSRPSFWGYDGGGRRGTKRDLMSMLTPQAYSTFIYTRPILRRFGATQRIFYLKDVN